MASAAKSRFRRVSLAENVDLVVEEHRAFHSVAVGLWVFSGSRSEAHSSEWGASHFIEHLLFKGTKTRSALDIALELEARGGDLNAFTDREMTCYHALVLPQETNKAIRLLSDMVLESTFPADEVERERGVILQEIAMVEDSPEEWAHDLFFECCWGKHPAAHTILGTKESITQMSRRDVMAWHHQTLKKSQLTISVAGPVSFNEVRRCVEKCFTKKLPKRSITKMVEEPQTTFLPGTYFKEKELEQAHVLLGYPELPYTHEDRYALFLMNTLLGGGMSSVLFQLIREKLGLAYSVYSSVSSLTDQGLFNVYVGTSADAVGKVLEVLTDESKRLTKTLMPSAELKLVKDKLIGSILMQADSMESRMMSLARNLFVFNRYVPVDEVVRSIRKVSSHDVRRVAKKLLDSEQCCTLVLGSED